jgi:hypothetical protein
MFTDCSLNVHLIFPECYLGGVLAAEELEACAHEPEADQEEPDENPHHEEEDHLQPVDACPIEERLGEVSTHHWVSAYVKVKLFVGVRRQQNIDCQYSLVGWVF